MVFNINSSMDFVSMLESYIAFDFYRSGDADDNMSLDEGGVHSLFSRCIIEVDGREVLNLDAYNVLHAVLSNSTVSEDHVDSMLFSEGDSSSGSSNDPFLESAFQTVRALTHTDISFVTASKTFTLVGGKATKELKPGDTLVLNNGGTSEIAEVVAVTTDLSFTIKDALSANADIALGAIDSVFVHVKGVPAAVQKIPMRQLVCEPISEATSTRVCFRPSLAFFQMEKWIPLFALRQGIRISFDLADPNQVFNYNTLPSLAPSSADARTYTITNPRFVAALYEPAESVLRETISALKGDGLQFPMMNYVHRRNTIQSTDTSRTDITLNFSVQSASHALAVLRGALISEGDTDVVRSNNSISTWSRFNMENYVFRVAGESFPWSERVKLDTYSSEALCVLKDVMNQAGSTLWQHRFEPQSWHSRNTLYYSTGDASTTDSSKLIMSTRFDKHHSYFSGLNLRNDPLIVELGFTNLSDGVLGNRILDCFVGHSVLMTIKDREVIIRK
jgi:hypothetical protein